MTNVREISPDNLHSGHHLQLVDGDGNELRINVVNGQTGKRDIRALRSISFPKTTLEVNTGAGQWSKRNPPFGQFVKSNFYGGFGMKDGEKDATKYRFGYGTWMLSPDKVMLAPELYHCTLPTPYKYTNMPGYGDTLVWYNIGKPNPTTAQQDYNIAVKFTPTSDITALGVNIILEGYGPTSTSVYPRVYCPIFSHDAVNDEPETILGNPSEDPIYITGSEKVSKCLWNSPVSLVGGTIYWILINYTAGATCEQTVNLLTKDNSAKVLESTDAITWVASGCPPPCFEIITNTDLVSAKFFHYKWGLYLYTTTVAGVTGLFLNGDRGAADDNAAHKHRLIDATKAWTTNQFANAWVRIYGGPGSGEWRRIVSNTGTILEVSPDWTVTHTTSTEYVIVGAKTWSAVRVLPVDAAPSLSFVEDAVRSQEDIVYFAQGDTRAIRRMREYNNAGVWTREFADDVADGASRIEAYYDQTKLAVIVRARNNGYGDVQKAPATAWAIGNLVFADILKISGQEQDINGLLEANQQLYVTKMDSVWVINEDWKPAKVKGWPALWNRTSGYRPSNFDKFIVWSVRDGIVRYSPDSEQMETFGPDLDDGLPVRNQGTPVETFPVNGMGALFAGIRAGSLPLYPYGSGTTGTLPYAFVGESGVYAYRGGGWHPVAELGFGTGFYAMEWQDIDDGRMFMWLCGRDGVYYMPFPNKWDFREDRIFFGDPQDPDYPLKRSGTIQLGRMNAGTSTLNKWWSKATVYADDTAKTYIDLYYRTTPFTETQEHNDSLTNWTYLGTYTNESEHTFNLGFLSKELYFLVVLRGDGLHTPVFKSISVDYLARINSANSWPISFLISDCQYSKNGVRQAMNAAQMLKLLRTWASTPQPLTMYSKSHLAHNLRVTLDSPGVQTMRLNEMLDEDGGRETDYCSITLIECEDIETIEEGA